MFKTKRKKLMRHKQSMLVFTFLSLNVQIVSLTDHRKLNKVVFISSKASLIITKINSQ